MKDESLQAMNRRLTERHALITGSRWCMSCSMYRRADSGVEVVKDAGNGRRARRWKCAVCVAKLNGKS